MAVRRDVEVVVLRAGGRPQRVTLEEGATVSEAIEEAGFTVKDRDEVTVNGDAVDHDYIEDQELTDGDRIVITAKLAGGR